jgi:hypothetical protein
MNKQTQLAVSQNTVFIIFLFTLRSTFFKLGSSKHVGHDVKNYNKQSVVSVNSGYLPNAAVCQSV